MVHLIDKDALVAEIRKRKSRVCGNDLYSEVKKGLYSSLEIYINTIEVKEVDLEKELNEFIEQQKAWIKDDRVVEYNNGDSFNHIYDLEDIAKHFFELGLKVAQKGESI